MTGSASHSSGRLRSIRRVGRGFSLIELIAVISILAVLSVSAGPVLKAVSSNRHAHAAGTLRRDVAFARQFAVTTGNRTWVVFDLAGQAYSLYGEDPQNPGRAGRVLLHDPALGKPFQVAMGAGSQFGGSLTQILIEGSGAEIGFDYLGAPLLEDESVMTQDALITVSGGRTIIVTAVTGHVYQQ